MGQVFIMNHPLSDPLKLSLKRHGLCLQILSFDYLQVEHFLHGHGHRTMRSETPLLQAC